MCQKGEGTGPNWHTCRLSCQNIARTDRDIQALTAEVLRMEDQAHLMPAPLRAAQGQPAASAA